MEFRSWHTLWIENSDNHRDWLSCCCCCCVCYCCCCCPNIMAEWCLHLHCKSFRPDSTWTMVLVTFLATVKQWSKQWLRMNLRAQRLQKPRCWATTHVDDWWHSLESFISQFTKLRIFLANNKMTDFDQTRGWWINNKTSVSREPAINKRIVISCKSNDKQQSAYQ